jgi:hypothetical protein
MASSSQHGYFHYKSGLNLIWVVAWQPDGDPALIRPKAVCCEFNHSIAEISHTTGTG